MAGFMCDIVTPVAKLVSDEVELVVVPGVEGEMGFLKGHAPLVSVLADGEARVKAVGASETVHYALQGGYVEVTDDKVIILADRALPAADIDVEQVREQLAGIEVPKRDGLAQCERFGFESGMIRGKSLCADGLRRKDEGERS